MSSLPIVAAPTTGRDLRLWRAIVLLAELPPPQAAGSPVPGRSENHVFEFDEAYTDFVDGFAELPTESQMLALQAVDTKVASMVALKDASIWTESARRDHSHWAELRALATRVLTEFNWPDCFE